MIVGLSVSHSALFAVVTLYNLQLPLPFRNILLALNCELVQISRRVSVRELLVHRYWLLIKLWWFYNQAEPKFRTPTGVGTGPTVFRGAQDESSPNPGSAEGFIHGAGFDTRSSRGPDLAIGSDSRRTRNINTRKWEDVSDYLISQIHYCGSSGAIAREYYWAIAREWIVWALAHDQCYSSLGV